MKNLIFILFIFALTKVSAQTYFSVEQEYPDGYNGRYSVDLTTLSTYSDDQIKKAFTAITNSEIYFNYPQGGCQNRAEMMHIILQNQLKMQHVKIWIFAPKDLYENDNRYLEIKD